MTVDMTAAELRQRLRRVGIWMPPPERTGIDTEKTAAVIEAAGFTSVWVGGGNATPDAFERLRPLLAALGPKMLELSRVQSLGAHPYFTPPEHTAFARSVLGGAPLLVPEQAVTLSPAAAPGARAYAERYLRLPNYTRNLERFGFTPDDLTGGGSDRLISAIIPSGPRATGASVRAHLDAGADHVVIQPLGVSGGFAPAALDELASAVAGLMSLAGRAMTPCMRNDHCYRSQNRKSGCSAYKVHGSD